VSVVASVRELTRRLLLVRETMILQRFADGLVFGVLYRRMPAAARGRIVSIAQICYPEVVGDGRSALRELVHTGPWIAARAAAAGAFAPQRLRYVPAHGERVLLFEVGFDSHHATYADRRQLVSPQLEDAIEAISRTHPGFFVGRFDVCAASAEDLKRGLFKVLELNGVASEPMHIYDPAINLGKALSVLRDQCRAAFEIGAANRAQGAALTPASALLRLIAREHAIHLASTFRGSSRRTFIFSSAKLLSSTAPTAARSFPCSKPSSAYPPRR
jgi:hypothetical protein